MEQHEKGLRMGPTVQQGGVQTIQQSIYLIHDNPCGINPILTGRLGSTGITAIEFIELLNSILVDELTQQARLGVVAAVQAYGADPSEANHLAYLKALTTYARACALIMLGLPPVEGYTYHLSLYDPSGAMIWDSYTPNLFVYKENTDGSLSYSTVKLLTAFPFASPLNPSGYDVPVFQINERPYLIPFVNINPTNPAFAEQKQNAQFLMGSQFLTNALAQSENIVSISSLLIDQANTRVYNKRQFGIGIRQIQAPNPTASNPYISYKRGFGYYVNYLSRFGLFPLDPNRRAFFEFMFIRLGLEQFDS